jgi:hypothetical protein
VRAVIGWISISNLLLQCREEEEQQQKEVVAVVDLLIRFGANVSAQTKVW